MKLVFFKIPPVVLGSFSNDFFKLCRDYFNSLEISNLGEFPMKMNSWGSHPSLDREKFVARCAKVLHETSCSDGKEMYQNVCWTCKVVLLFDVFYNSVVVIDVAVARVP